MASNDNRSTPTLSDEEIFAYLDGEADVETAQRMNDAANRRRAQELMQTEQLLQTAIGFRSACPPPERLWEYVHEQLSDGAHTAVKTHTAGCDDCRSEIALIEKMAPHDEPAALSGVVRRAAELWAEAKEVLTAVLQPPPAPAPALRGAGEPVPLTYEVGEFQIMLEMPPPRGREATRRLQGQVETADFTPLSGQVLLERNAAPISHTRLDETGYFEFDDLSPDQYRLRMQMPQATLLIDDVTIE